jgi:hypothetical protein
MLIHVQITTFWLQRKLEQRKQRQTTNNMNKLKMFETKQVTPDLTKNLNPFFCPRAKTNLISGPWTSCQDHQLCCTHQKCHSTHTEHTNVDSRSSQGLSKRSHFGSICCSPTVHGHELPIEPLCLQYQMGNWMIPLKPTKSHHLHHLQYPIKSHGITLDSFF